MATIPSSEIIAELAKHPYKQTDKVQIGGSDHYVKVFVLGTQTPKIIEDSGNPSSIAQACDDILCVGKKGIVVDGTTCYVLKETTPCGTFKRAVVFESSTNAQIVGVVDNDSVQLSTQQGGGIKVASTLPNGGDFVGQICVLTTGSTYVWTGSEWSSTAGSSTLPTPTSANKYYGLVSTGAAWEPVRSAGITTGGSATSQTAGVWLIPLYEATATYTHFGGDVQFGFHGDASTKVHVEFACLGQRLPTAHDCGVTILGYSTHNRTTTVAMVAGLYYKIENGTGYYYLGVNLLAGQYIKYTVFNRIGDSEDHVPSNTTPIALTTETKVDGAYINTSVPVSTDSNQMLVSDGNGGWTTAKKKILCLVTDGVPASWTGKYYYKKIATHSAASGKRGGQLSVDYTIGAHSRASFNGKLKLTLTSNSLGETSHGVSVLEYPAYTLPSGSAVTNQPYYMSQWWKTDIGVTLNTTDQTLDVYLILYGIWSDLGYPPRFTLDNIVCDEDWTFPNSTSWDGEQLTTLPSTITLGFNSVWQVPPATTTADNGKVLTVSNGVPTWVTPS